MNKTQKLITTSFTLSHAVMTIKDLKDNAKSQLEIFSKENHTDSLTFKKLEKIYNELDSLLKKAEATNFILCKIDNNSPGEDSNIKNNPNDTNSQRGANLTLSELEKL